MTEQQQQQTSEQKAIKNLFRNHVVNKKQLTNLWHLPDGPNGRLLEGSGVPLRHPGGRVD
jgi:hypothetical protein